MANQLEIRLLGEPEVLRNGASVTLPASKKSRALLAYLASTGRPHLRERLCELLWDGPDDPRAALRWSLTKLRPLVDPHLVSQRDHVEFVADGAMLDIAQICTPGNATTESLETCAALFRGEFLDGLDLPACFRYQQWCVAERERFRNLHIAILGELTRRHGCSEKALPHARRRVAVDPFSEAAHASLVRLLASLGNTHEALRQYDYCRTLFERELGARTTPVLEDARRAIGRTAVEPAVVAKAAPPEHNVPFVGRAGELRAVEMAAASGRVVLLTGEPGIGKSRLAQESTSQLRGGGAALYGRAFAAEMIRPYGIWIDALQPVGGLPTENDRTRLFDAVVAMLAGTSLVTLDDLQWIDDASAALLHYVVRATRDRGLRVVCTARSGELEDNAAASRVVRELSRQKCLTEISISPLTEGETAALVGSAPDAERIVKKSGGNPLFAIELARTQHSGSLSEVLNERLARLEPSARELVSWAAAVGRQFDVDIVGRATGMPAGEMLAALTKLERGGVIRASGDRCYDFSHDLIRDAAYQLVTGPRRLLMHRHILRALAETHDADGALAGEIVHHASMAGEHEIAATAAIDAGKRCLRLFAYTEAVNVARRGLQMTEALSAEKQIDIRTRLLHIVALARTPMRERLPLLGSLADVVAAARAAGLTRAASLGAHALAIVSEELNDYSRAADATRESAELSRSTDPATAALSIANSARCLLFLQRDIGRAESLLREAEALGIESTELALGFGFLHAHRGEASAAALFLERAFELATRDQDHWREFVALSRLTTVALESANPALALRHCQRLQQVAAKMTGGSEGARTELLEAISHFAAGREVDLDGPISRVREFDCKSDLAWALGFLAEAELERGDATRARKHAEEALQFAKAVGKDSDTVVARCVLADLDHKTIRLRASNDLTARARNRLQRMKRKERTLGHPRARTVVSKTHQPRRAQ